MSRCGGAEVQGGNLERLGGEKVGRREGEEVGELDAGEVRT